MGKKDSRKLGICKMHIRFRNGMRTVNLDFYPLGTLFRSGFAHTWELGEVDSKEWFWITPMLNGIIIPSEHWKKAILMIII